jgi:hypothetical protein
METIPIYIESVRGHDTFNVPNSPPEIQKMVEAQLKDDKWVTIEKNDGSSELLTTTDLPKKPLMEQADTTTIQADTSTTEEVKLDELGDMDLGSVEKGKSDADDDDDEGDDDDDKETETKSDWVDKGKGVGTISQAKKVTTQKPIKERDEWESKFADVKSATATHKNKGG